MSSDEVSFPIPGDLTDAKDVDDRRSKQFVEEWQQYQQSIEHCKTLTSATFLDTRGNHGLCFLWSDDYVILYKVREIALYKNNNFILINNIIKMMMIMLTLYD